MNTLELLETKELTREIVADPNFGPEENVDVCGIKQKGIWQRYEHDTAPEPMHWKAYGPEFGQAVMTNVRFAKREWNGCGGMTHSGHAIGRLQVNATVTINLMSRARKLTFDPCTGHFLDRETRVVLTHVRMLILENGLKSAYIP